MDYLFSLGKLAKGHAGYLLGEWGRPTKIPIKCGDRVRVWGIEGRLLSVEVEFSVEPIPMAEVTLLIEVKDNPWEFPTSKEVVLKEVPFNQIEAIEEEKEMSNITVTKERIDHLMKTAKYETMTVFDKCTVVVAQLENGFILSGTSACVDPANYDKTMGERFCKEQIREKLWMVEGYALQKALYKLTQEA